MQWLVWRKRGREWRGQRRIGGILRMRRGMSCMLRSTRGTMDSGCLNPLPRTLFLQWNKDRPNEEAMRRHRHRHCNSNSSNSRDNEERLHPDPPWRCPLLRPHPTDKHYKWMSDSKSMTWSVAMVGISMQVRLDHRHHNSSSSNGR